MTESIYKPGGELIEYPTSDGQPMAETARHARWMNDTIGRLDWRYRDAADVNVGGNQLLYYVQGDIRKSLAPDVYVIFGVDKEPLDNILIWKLGKAPDVVFEITSRSTRNRDLGVKKEIYQQIGVREYFLYDPNAEYLDPPLIGYRLAGEDDPQYVRIAGPPLISIVLDLILSLDDRKALVLRDRATGERLLSEAEWWRREAEERAAAEAERAQHEAERADRAEARLREFAALIKGHEGSD